MRFYGAVGAAMLLVCGAAQAKEVTGRRVEARVQEREAAPVMNSSGATELAPQVESSAISNVTGRPYLPVFGKQIALAQSLRALGHRNFRLFWTGQLISLVGTWMQTVARAWLVLELTHSAFWLGMVGVATSLPVLVFSLWGGVLADRFAKRTLIIWTQAIQMVLALGLAWLTLTGQVQVWHIMAVSLM